MLYFMALNVLREEIPLMNRSPFLSANSGLTQAGEEGTFPTWRPSTAPASPPLSRSQDGGAEGPGAGPGAPARARVR